MMLEARGLTLSWDGAHAVARDVTLGVDAGEIVCLLGRSGCGKTTLLHALSGLTRPMSGQVLLDGRDVTGEPGHVSYMLQKDLLLPNKRILDNVCLPLVLAGMPKAEAHAKAEPLFERFGLEGTEGKWPSQLSGGMRQRAAFMRTYLMGNRAVLLDEPFSALDALTRADLRSWYCSMSRELGLATLAITHDVDEALAMADRIVVLAKPSVALGTGSLGSGAANASVPSRISGEVVVPAAVDDFEFSPQYLACKKKVLELLG